MSLRTRGGRPLAVVGDEALLTMDRLERIRDHLDTDPRIASVSVVHAAGSRPSVTRGTAPAGAVVVAARDLGDLAGDLPEHPDPIQLAAWARQASERGLWHDWLVAPDADLARVRATAERSSIDAQEAADPSSNRAAGALAAPIRADRLTVTVDVTWLGGHETGAQVLTTAAVAALARQPAIATITLVGRDTLPAYAAHLLDLPKVTLRGGEQASSGGLRSDIAWYPNQADQRTDIGRARELGRRVVTTYLDLIAYDIPRYHGTSEGWASYRALQRRIALSVDGITTISADVARRLEVEVPGLDPARVRPIPLGLDHLLPESVPAEPDGEVAAIAGRLRERPFVLVLGNDFRHKNRDLSIRAWQRLLEQGIACDLVLAGLHVRSSSSRQQEEALLARHADLRGRAHVVGHVSSASRAWLLANAAAVHYPTSAEGFGFVPYEAAVLGTPSTFAAFGPLTELIGAADASTLPRGWDADEHARDLARLLTDPPTAASRLAALRDAVARRPWDAFAAELAAFLAETAARPPVDAALLGDSAADSARLAAVLGSRTWRATAPLRAVGRRVRRR